MAKPPWKPKIYPDFDFPVHPYREIVPNVTASTYKALLADIAENGQNADIVLDRQERIIDGRARLRACLELGLKPRCAVSDREDIATYVMSTLTAFQSYSKPQKAFTAARLLEPLAEERKRKNFTGRVANAAGDLVGGVSAPYVTEAKTIITEFPDILPLVDNRRLYRFTHVRALAALSEEKRIQAIEKIDSGKDPAVVLKDAAVNKGDEWYTPLDVATAVKWAFGGGKIPCDPCHPVNGQSPVEAALSYTELDDGLDDANNWANGTFINPPYSETRLWIARAIREAEENGNRIYMLLPVRPSSVHQRALINASIDVLFLNKRLSFGLPQTEDGEEPSVRPRGTGQSALMIVGLLCSTRPLLEMGIEGNIIASSDRDVLSIPEDVKKPWVFERAPREEEPDLSGIGELFEDDRNMEFAEASQLSREQRAIQDDLILKGRAAVAEARIKMAEDEGEKKKRRTSKSTANQKSKSRAKVS